MRPGAFPIHPSPFPIPQAQECAMSPAAVRTLRVPLGRARNTPTSWRELRPAAVATRCAPVPIREAHGGLALQRTLDQAGWCVVHVASGSRVTPTYRLQREARA